MKIIGHRGVAGLELENTRASLKRAKALGVDAIEFDVRLTKDRQLVLCHDAHTGRVSNTKVTIDELTLKELRKITLKNGETIPTLEEALKIVGSTPVFVEPKVDGLATELLEVIGKFPEAAITIVTFQHALGAELQRRQPGLELYLAEHFHPTKILRFIRLAEADGIGLNFWLLNPYTYWLVRHRNIKLYVYTINSPILVRFVHWLYPAADLCTDHPERFVKTGRARGSA